MMSYLALKVWQAGYKLKKIRHLVMTTVLFFYEFVTSILLIE